MHNRRQLDKIIADNFKSCVHKAKEDGIPATSIMRELDVSEMMFYNYLKAKNGIPASLLFNIAKYFDEDLRDFYIEGWM